jgi:hypothetical protein
MNFNLTLTKSMIIFPSIQQSLTSIRHSKQENHPSSFTLDSMITLINTINFTIYFYCLQQFFLNSS